MRVLGLAPTSSEASCVSSAASRRVGQGRGGGRGVYRGCSGVYQGATGGVRGGGMEGKVWRSTHKAVHTQDGAHTRQFVATTGVLLFKGKGGAGAGPALSEARRLQSEASHGEGLAVHTQGLWDKEITICTVVHSRAVFLEDEVGHARWFESREHTYSYRKCRKN